MMKLLKNNLNYNLFIYFNNYYFKMSKKLTDKNKPPAKDET